MMQRITDVAPSVQFRDCSPSLAKLRAVKSPAEIERMRQAIAVSDAGQRAARALIAKGAGRREYEVEAAVQHAYRAAGATLAFASIVGSGVNAAILHYEHNDGEMKQGDLVVVDIGATRRPLQRRRDAHLSRRRPVQQSAQPADLRAGARRAQERRQRRSSPAKTRSTA
jgi:Xaa-Pro aminopeptidase